MKLAVKLSPPITIMCVVIAAHTWLAVSRYQLLHRDRDASCTIAQDYVTRKLAVQNGPVLIVPIFNAPFNVEELEKRLRSSRDIKHDPRDLRLIRHQVQIGEIDPIRSCGNLLAYLERERIPHPSQFEFSQIMKKTWDRGAEKYPWTIIGLSMPAIDRSSGIGWFQASLSFGLLSGDVRAVTYKLNRDGSWTLNEEAIIAVS